MFDFTKHSEVSKYLPKETQRRGFNRLLNHGFLATAIYNKYDLLEPFPVPNKILKTYNYHRYEKLLSPFVKRVGSYTPPSSKGAKDGISYHYQFTPQFFNFDLLFIDTPMKENAIKYDVKPELIDIVLNALNSVTINTQSETVKTNKGKINFKSKPVKTLQEANIYFNRYLSESITRDYIINRNGINLEKGTRFLYGINRTIDMPIGEFIQMKAKASAISAGYILNSFRQKQFYASISKTNNRLHNSFTAISEAMHPYIKLDNEPIQGKDLSNSQFLLLAHLIENSLPNSKNTLLTFIKDNGYLTDFVGKGQKVYQMGTLIEMFKNIVSQVKIENDINLFMKTAFNGTLYSDFAERTGLTEKLGAKRARDYAKNIFILAVFGNDEDKDKESKSVRLFKEIYPSVFEIISHFKTGTNYSVLPVFLQRIESIIFIDSLMVLLHYKGIKTITKHDSIYTSKNRFNRMNTVLTGFLDTILDKNYHLKE